MRIEFIEGENGNMIPAQKIRSVYGLTDGKLGKLTDIADMWGFETVYVSHFETCPSASEFSKK